jgi:hypothetical protein
VKLIKLQTERVPPEGNNQENHKLKKDSVLVASLPPMNSNKSKNEVTLFYADHINDVLYDNLKVAHHPM